MMDQVQELFEHELEDIYYAERKLVSALDEMAGESADPAIKRAFTEHKTQTEGHITRLDTVFASLGKKPEAVKCEGIEGLIKEKKSFAKEKPTPQVLDVFNLGAGAKSERYEISAYEGLIAMANALGLTQAQQALRQNLQEEEHALSVVKNLAKTALTQAAAAPAAR
jgi:ferritin-like metal-binding protein YciE